MEDNGGGKPKLWMMDDGFGAENVRAMRINNEALKKICKICDLHLCSSVGKSYLSCIFNSALML